MKTSTWFTAGLYLVLAARSLTVAAADPRITRGPVAAPARGLFGLPIPQQWSANRGGYSATGYGQYSPTRYNPACPNGNCQTGAGLRTGYGTREANCADGQCATGSCVNGNCTTGHCRDGQCLSGNCLNGNCAAGVYEGYRQPQGVQHQWSPRSSRTGLTDPARRSSDYSEEHTWSQRTRRPVLAPVDDAFGSRYRRDDLNLRDDYFGSEDRPMYDSRVPSQPRTRLNSSEWDRPSRRSLEAPAESAGGVARF